MSFYAEMQDVASELLAEFSQGTIAYVEDGPPTGDPWAPGPGAPVSHPVNAVRVAGKRLQTYIDGGQIVATDVLLAVSVFDADPKMSGRMNINGEDYQIVMVDKSTLEPTAPIAWFVGCRK